MVYAYDLGSYGVKPVEVRVLSDPQKSVYPNRKVKTPHDALEMLLGISEN